MKLVEFETIQDAYAYLASIDAVHNLRDPKNNPIDKRHGYRIYYVTAEKDVDPYIELEHGVSCVCLLSNKFKDTKSVVCPVFTLKPDHNDVPATIAYWRRETYEHICYGSTYCFVNNFNGLLHIVGSFDHYWNDYQEVGFLLIMDMVYDHRKNALLTLMDLAISDPDEP